MKNEFVLDSDRGFADLIVRTRMSAVLAHQDTVGRRGCTSNLGSPKSLGKIAGESHLLRASLISLHDIAGIAEDDRRNDSVVRRRSPSLPPIYTRESGISLQQFVRTMQLYIKLGRKQKIN